MSSLPCVHYIFPCAKECWDILWVGRDKSKLSSSMATSWQQPLSQVSNMADDVWLLMLWFLHYLEAFWFRYSLLNSMNTKVRGPEDYEEQGFKLPKSRNLLPSKKYRDSVLRWGEPNELKRRRVIIVPSIKCSARDISATTDGKGRRKLIQDTWNLWWGEWVTEMF